MLSRNVLYYGKEEALPERRTLRAGPLSLIFEQGDLRYIRLGEHEVVRRMYVAVRDRNWGTAPAELSNIVVDAGEDSFHIAYDETNRLGDVDFAWHAEIRGDARGTITFTMDGVARSTFMRNRLGFCVLHPMRECAGQTCAVEHDDGTVEHSRFPQLISPFQPFKEIRAISYQAGPGARAEVRFDGDVFEMEDQRNWTDASFKTYCTPLRLPHPAEVRAGTRIAQSVTLALQAEGAEPVTIPHSFAAIEPEVVTFTVQPGVGMTLPRIGLGMASHAQPPSPREIERLKRLNLSHLRVDLNLSGDLEAPLHHATDLAHTLGVSLEAALFVSSDADRELAHFATTVLPALHPPVSAWLVYHRNELSTASRWSERARVTLQPYDSAPLLGSGSDSYFVYVNRERPLGYLLDLVCYAISPQVHAFDNASLVETLPAQRLTVMTAREFTLGWPVAVSTVTLRPRFNPDAIGPEPPPAPGELPPQVDPRQMSLFGAGWTLGSLKYLAESECYSATYYETTGWRGVMEIEGGSPLPDQFPSLPGAVFPLYHVFADVGEFAGGRVLLSNSSDSLVVEGIALEKDGRRRVVVANLGPQPQQVRVNGLGHRARVRLLDETNAEVAMQSPEAFRAERGEEHLTADGALVLSLQPYGLARIDEFG